MTKSLPISKRMVWDAYLRVKSNRGSAGVDRISLSMFGKDLKNQLYKLWNRLSSGSYYPPPVREVLIPKSDGKTRKLGIPTVSDRIAQQVVKDWLEPRLDWQFHEHSYGYRPLRSAHDALGEVRRNVRDYAWVVDMDIKSFFDEMDHGLLMKALDRHVPERWIKMYVQRWLEAPSQDSEGHLQERQGKGTPQGGVISPLLANLYLHYAFDKWMDQSHPSLRFVRYADDVVIHCRTQEEAEAVLVSVKDRLAACSLRLSEEKTKIVHCRDYRRKDVGAPVRFDFLGYRFQPMPNRSRYGGWFLGYDCSISPKSKKRIAQKWKELSLHRWTGVCIEQLAKEVNPILRGICQYYGQFRGQKLNRVFRRFHFRLCKWVLNKYKRFGRDYSRGYQWLYKVQSKTPDLFAHWELGYTSI